MQYRPGYPQTSTAIQEEIWIDVSKRVDYQSLQWEQQATEQNTALRFDIFTMLNLSTTRYDDYASWGTSGNGLDAYTQTSLGMVDAINDPSFFIDIANRTEVKVQEWALVSGHYEVVRTLWGGVVSSVDTERQGDAFVVQRVECADYTALLDELIIRDYNAPTVSAILGERPTISGLTTEVIAGGLTLTAGPYTFRVVAYNASDEIVEIFTHVSQNLTATDIDPPGISDPELRTIRLNWSTVAGATYYKVFAKSGIGVKDMYYKDTVTSPAATYSLSTAPAVAGDLSPEDKVQKGSIDVDIISGSSDPANANYKGIFNGLDPDLDPGIDNQTAYVETAKKLNDGTPDPEKSYRFSPTLETGIVLTSPFGGKTLKQALNIIKEKTGGVFWVDANKDLHYTNKQARELVENPRFESSPASSGYSIAGGHSILQDRGPYGYGRALVASAGATTAESQTSAIPVNADQYYFARAKGWAKTNFSLDWDAELRFYSNLAATTQVGVGYKLQRNISFDSTDDGRWCKAWAMAKAHATAVTARIVFNKKRNGGDEVAWTDFSLVKVTGGMGFSDSPSDTAYALPMKSFETPKAPRSASKVANRLLVYGVYKDANNPSELESVETDISLTLRKVLAGTLAAGKYYVRVVATVGTTEIICKYATETITDQDVIDGNRELYASWAAVTGASSYKIYVGTKRFAMRLKATQPGTTLSIQSPAAGGAAISLEPSVYYYKVFDFAPGIWEAGGKIIEAAINDSLVDNDDKASTRALSFWEEKGIAERTWEFDTFETEVPMVGEVIPFVWVADDTAEPLMVKGIKAKLLGDRVYYTVTVGDDPLLTKRGVTQIFADMQAATARLNDTIAPEAPQSLAVTAPLEALLQTPDGVTRASVTAQWTPSPEDDFAHYSVEYGYDPNFTEVQRANVSQTSDSQSASTGVKANVVHTFQADPGRTLYYRVAAIDNTNNKSPWSSEEIELPQDETPCEAPYNVLVAPGLKSNTVTWLFDFYNPESPLINKENTDFARFRIYRRVHNTGAYAVIAETSATQYVDTDFANYSAGYNYAVTSLDRTGNESGTPGNGGATGVAYNTTSNVPSKIDGGVDITTASITGAEIANATITDANIDSLSATKITAGTLNVSTGMTIVSDGTAAAPQFEVDKDGVTIRDDSGNIVLQVNGSNATLNADFIDVNGLTATEITVGTGNGVVRVGNYPNSTSPTFQGIWGGNADPSSAAFTLNTSGIMTATSASITGSVTATSGAIGGWSLTSTSLSGGNTTIASTGDITVGSGESVARLSSSDAAYRLWLGGTTASTAPFRVTSTGSFVATSANVTGTISTSNITATGGTVGGWTLSSSSLTAGSGTSAVGINATGAGPAIFAGSSSGTSAPFQVSNTGAVQARNITVLGGEVLIGKIGPEITEISLAATTGIVTVTTTTAIETDDYSVGTKILVDVSGTYGSDTWANGYFVIASVSGSTLTYESNNLVDGPLSDLSATGRIYLGSQMAVGGDGGSTAAWMTVEGNKFALRNPADPLVNVIEATASAVTINADFINAGSLNIGDLDANALTTTNFSVTNAGVVTAGTGNNVSVISPTDSTYRLWIGHSTGAAAPFSVTSTGAISATSGSVGGWTLSSTSFTGGNTTIASAGDITLGTGENVARISSTDPAYRLWLGGSTASTAPFRVTSTGAVTATNANISGTVTATSGAIGGWTLSSTSLTGGDTTISSAGDITVGSGSNIARISSSDPAYRLWLGGTTSSTAPFRVTSTGELTATSASITGTITANSGAIGTWTISSDAISSIDVGGDYSGLYHSDANDGRAFFAGATSQSGAAAKFYVQNDGALYAESATITGAVTATSGSFTGTISASAGQIGGWAIGSDRITNLGATKYAGIIDTAADDGLAFFAGATSSSGASALYSVTNAGALTATNATISGSVTATDGAIGGWLLTSNSLTSSNTTISSTGDITLGTGSNVARLSSSDPVYRLWLGSSTGSAAPFSVTSTGSISASAGTIGGFALSSTSLTAGTGSSAVGLLPGTFPFFAGNSTASSAPFRVTSGGAVTSSNINITGGPAGGNVINIGSGQFSVDSSGYMNAKTGRFSPGSGTVSSGQPALLLIGSSVTGDITYTSGQSLNIGITTATQGVNGAFTEYLRLDANGNMRLNDGYFAVGQNVDAIRLNTSGLVSVGNGTNTAGDLRVYGNGTAGSNGAIRIYGGTPGTTNGATLSFDGANARFNMNNDLNVAGALTGVTTLNTSSTVTAGGVLNANSSASVGLKVINGIALGAVDGIYWGVDTTGPNLFYSSGWRFSQTTAAASTVDAVFNGASSTATSQTLVRVSSSERYKENISFVDFPLNEIVKLQPSEYQYREEWRGTDDNGNPLPAQTQVGIIAESATSNSVWSKLVVNDGEGRPDSWRYSLMGPVLLSAVRQLNDKITALEARIAELESR
jgi:hypothetical protein